MSDQANIVVIGAGQAGLCISYHLTQLGHEHVILEKASSTIPAWRNRWDSFTLVLPNWTVRLPGTAVPENGADNFFTRDELVSHFEDFVASFQPRIQFNTQVLSVEQNGGHHNYLVHTNRGTIEANHVVVAAGTFQQPKIPALSKNISPDIVQLHTDHYRNPDELPGGAVLVVGTGQSGAQIAQDLYTDGRKVYLSVSGAPRVPRTYRGKDIIWWLDQAGFLDAHVSTLESSKERFASSAAVTGRNGGGDLNPHQFARDGVTLLGHVRDGHDSIISFVPDLHENLAKSDEFVAQIKGFVDGYIADNGIDAPPAAQGPPLRDGYSVEVIEELDLNEAGISTVIWATGYQFDYSWIKLDLLDQDKYPIQERGVSAYPGLYFIGLYFMHTRKSGLLPGVSADAEYLARYIDRQL